MPRGIQDAREHINIIKKIDAYIQHKPSDWQFKELVRTIALEIENNRKYIADLQQRIANLEEKVGIKREE